MSFTSKELNTIAYAIANALADDFDSESEDLKAALEAIADKIGA